MKNNKDISGQNRKDFYMKFNVKDFMTDSNVRECGPESIGIYIFILCVLFNSKERGKYLIKSEALKNFAEILPRQNVQQTEQQIKTICRIFAERLVKHLPFTENEISAGLVELISNDILYFDGYYLCQKRMIRDASISKARSNAGKKGASVTNKQKKEIEILPQQNGRQNGRQNPNYNYNNNNIDNKGSNSSLLKVNSNINNNVVVDEILKKSNINKEAAEEKIEPEPGSAYSQQVYQISEANQHLQHPIEVCLWNYLNNPIYERAKGMHLIRLKLDADPEIALKKIEPWAEAFNRSLLSSGKSKMQMVGISGNSDWVSYFPNWVNRTKSQSPDPEKLFTEFHDLVKITKNIDTSIADETDPEKKRALQKQIYNAEILNKRTAKKQQ